MHKCNPPATLKDYYINIQEIFFRQISNLNTSASLSLTVQKFQLNKYVNQYRQHFELQTLIKNVGIYLPIIYVASNKKIKV